MKGVEHKALVAAPQRGDQKLFRAVTGDAVYGHLRRKKFHAVYDKINIFTHFQDRKGGAAVKLGQVRALQYVEQL